MENVVKVFDFGKFPYVLYTEAELDNLEVYVNVNGMIAYDFQQRIYN
jgi:hypothetical protein